jgi:hypothetical protein
MANGKDKCGCIEGKGAYFERNNYFCGKLMVERDFWAEQHYHMGKQMIHNAYLHGWGTVCCLKVDPHPNCPNLKVLVRSGMAIDCYGREIVLPGEVQVDLESYNKNGSGSTSKPKNLYVCLSYKECETEPVTVFLDDCGCKEECEANRIRETYEIEILTDDDFAKEALPENLYSVIVSGKKVISGSGNVNISKGWEQFDSGKVDGSITIRTSNKKRCTLKIEDFDTVKELMDKINGAGNQTKVKITYDSTTDKFILACDKKDEVIILEQTGTNPLFPELKIPAYHSVYKKVINPCPGCPDNTKIILAVIEDYDKVTGDYLDPNKSDFKTAAYTINNFIYRMTAPNMGFIDKVIHYLVKKGL